MVRPPWRVLGQNLPELKNKPAKVTRPPGKPFKLRAEHAAHCRSKEEMAEMAEKLKSAVDRCRLLEKEDQAKQTDLEKSVANAKDARSAMRAAKEELRQAEQIAAGKPFML